MLTVFLPIVTLIFLGTRTSVFVSTTEAAPELALRIILFMMGVVVLGYGIVVVGSLRRINQLKNAGTSN